MLIAGTAYSDRTSSYTEKFQNSKDAEEAFSYLFYKVTELFDEMEFRICNSVVAAYPEKFVKKVKNAKNSDDIFNALNNPAFCNWLNIRPLKRIANIAEISEAQNIIRAYEECIYSKKVLDLKPFFKANFFKPGHFAKVETKVNKNAKAIIVSDVIGYCENLEGDLNLPEGTVNAADCTDGCLTIKLSIPVYCLYHAFTMANKLHLKFRQYHIQYLQVESYPKVFSTQLINSKELLSELFSSAAKCKFLCFVYAKM